MTKEEKLKHCKGCEDNYYNRVNETRFTQCWMLQGAKLVSRKKVPITQEPPWTQKPKLYFNCYRQLRFLFVQGNRTH